MIIISFLSLQRFSLRQRYIFVICSCYDKPGIGGLLSLVPRRSLLPSCPHEVCNEWEDGVDEALLVTSRFTEGSQTGVLSFKEQFYLRSEMLMPNKHSGTLMLWVLSGISD